MYFYGVPDSRIDQTLGAKRLDMLYFMFCLFGRHRADRRMNHRGKDGSHRSTCAGCGRPMLMDHDTYRWKAA